MKQSGFNPCRECGVIPEVYAFGKVARCPKCKQIQSGENFDHLVFEWNKANPEKEMEFDPDGPEETGSSLGQRFSKVTRPYLEIMKALDQIAETNKRILELEQMITAKICQEEKGGRD